MSENKDRFVSLVRSINREGINELVEFLEKSDFYTAPASTRFHCSIQEGLLIHSLNVYDMFEQKRKTEPYKTVLGNISDDSSKIITLFHDICKTYMYETDYKNKKIYSETGSKKDEKGRFDWQAVEFYKVNDLVPYGHGEKSVMMLEEFIKLQPIEVKKMGNVSTKNSQAGTVYSPGGVFTYDMCWHTWICHWIYCN